jgi:hypothetical protein
MRPDTASATRFHSGVIIVPQRERGVCESAADQSEQLLNISWHQVAQAAGATDGDPRANAGEVGRFRVAGTGRAGGA